MRNATGTASCRTSPRQTNDALQLGPGTLYGCLKRMLAAGMVEESDERPDPALDDERRRYYRMTALGRRVVRAEAQRLAEAVSAAKARRLFDRPERRRHGRSLMPQTQLMRWFCRLYLVMLYAYPREFRLQFGGEMQQLFRDRCRQMTRTPGRRHWLRFAMESAADWISTMFQERMAAVRELTFEDCGRKTFQVVRTAWSRGRRTQPRGFVAEWAMTLIIFLFATTTLVQAYVVPTGSMEGTVLVGDHMLVDRMTYSNPGAWGSHLLPYRDVKRGDIVAFHYPEDVRADLRQACHRNSGRPHPYGKQTGGAQRPSPSGTVHAAHRSDA